MRKINRIILTLGIWLVLSASPVYAAEWRWIDMDLDGYCECYYFDNDNEVFLKNRFTPDGYQLNDNGAWVVDGVVQTRERIPHGQAEGTIQIKPGDLIKGSVKTSQLGTFNYLLFTPPHAEDNMPLFIFLHGHGMPSIDHLDDDITVAELVKVSKRRNSAYVLAPLLPPELDFGAKGMWPGIEPSILELLESVVETCKIDRNRIYIVGNSMGADSAVQIVANNPNLFAGMTGIVPFHYQCPMKRWEDGWGEKFKNVPSWFFIEDEISAIKMARTAADDICNAGGQAWVTVKEGAIHGQAGDLATAQMPEIYTWMLSLSRPTESVNQAE